MVGKNKILFVIILLLLGANAFIIVQYKSSPKTGYVLIQELYNGFEMKKEMEKKYLQVKNSREKILDSLTLELKILSQKIAIEKEKNPETIQSFESKRAEFIERKQMFEEDNNALSQKYDQEILTQLNQYTKDFGKANGYTYIFGNDGNGSLMFSEDSQNITNEVIEFINNKYKGVE